MVVLEEQAFVKYIASSEYFGLDVVRFFELSWLNSTGKPEIALLEVILSNQKLYRLDSKTFKEFLNSLSDKSFDRIQDIQSHIARNLTEVIGSDNFTLSLTGKRDFYPATNCKNLMLSTISKLCNYEVVSEVQSHNVRFVCCKYRQPYYGMINIVSDISFDASMVDMILNQERSNEFSLEEYVEHIYSNVLDKCADTFCLVSLHISRRGGVSWQFIRSNKDINLTPFIKRSEIE